MDLVRLVQRIFYQIINSTVGPSLYKKYKSGAPENVYQPIKLEKYGENGVQLLKLLWRVGSYTSMFWGPLLIYKKGYDVFTFLYGNKLIGYYGLAAVSAVTLREISRRYNPEYVRFYSTLKAFQKDVSNKELKKSIMEYDFDFSAWPVEYAVQKRSVASVSSSRHRAESVFYFPCRIVASIATYCFALKMVYPGAVKLVQYGIADALLQGRVSLVEKFGGERFKLKSSDDNEIDALFIDRRQNKSKYANGDTLVVVCEGNCGFYEVGCVMTPVEAGYSVLGWNHPGFGGSTGSPYPSQEQNAIDAVMQFAINHLGFKPHQIILYGWSIGGYTSSWAAMNYPEVKGLILDATFDDILPLALSRMPDAIGFIVRRIIRDNINLNVYENVSNYPGPVMFVRRAEDEMICTEMGDFASNRCNNLVKKFLKKRFPKLIENKHETLLDKWLTSDHLERTMLRDQMHIDNDLCSSLLTSYIEDNSTSYPMLIGESLSDDQKSQLTLFLAEKHMKEFRSTHCTPLPINMFRLPWAPATSESGFVTVTV